MPQKLKLILGVLFFGALVLFNPTEAFARTDFYKEYNVDFYINKDSSVRVEEEIVLFYDGEYHGTHRYIDLTDSETLKLCQQNENLQCGGFDFLTIDEVWSEENGVLTEGQDYQLIQNEYEDGSKQLDIRYEFSADGREFNAETFTWGVKYRAFGSLGYFDDYDLFYWDTLISDRSVDIQSATIKIHFPENIASKIDHNEDLTTFVDATYQAVGDTITLKPIGILPPGEPFTVLLKFPKGIVDEPATLTLSPRIFGVDMGIFSTGFSPRIFGKNIISNDNEYNGIPTGNQKIEFDSVWLSANPIELDLKSGEERDLVVDASPNFFGMILIGLFGICNFIGVFLLFFGLVYPFFKWYTQGRDQGGRKTIVPWFSPPNDISTSLLGTIKDESVDMVDITATLIDTAYRGYLKIREVEKDEYEFIKLKPFDDIKPEERVILDAIFSFGETKTGLDIKYKDEKIDEAEVVSTTDLKNNFYTKIPEIQNTLYDKMVSEGYFAKRPDQVRGGNFGLGIFLLIFSVVGGIIAASITAGISILFLGLICTGVILFSAGTIAFAYFMPAKTPKGTLTVEQIYGFKMYLHTAERFRLQKLTPETFEKYLSYAMVFGIENEWAEKFKDIYKGNPDWYEGTHDGNYWTPYLLSRSLHNMNMATNSVVSSKPASSGSSFSGGGWSGGGGFSGGFSGGGGGGGGGGSW